MGFSSVEVSIFIAVIGILSILAQLVLGFLMRWVLELFYWYIIGINDYISLRVLGAKRTIILGLVFEMLQMLWYGFGSQMW